MNKIKTNHMNRRGPCRAVLPVLGFVVVVTSLPAAGAQDIVAELKYLCDRSGGILDEDNQCIDPVVVQGGDDVIPLSDVELPELQRMAASRLSQDGPLETPEPIDGPVLQPGLSVPGFGTHFSVTQEQGLRMCFNTLEYEVRTCHYAFPKDVQAHNQCVQAAGDTYQDCLRWVQTLPYEEIQQ